MERLHWMVAILGGTGPRQCSKRRGRRGRCRKRVSTWAGARAQRHGAGRSRTAGRRGLCHMEPASAAVNTRSTSTVARPQVDETDRGNFLWGPIRGWRELA